MSLNVRLQSDSADKPAYENGRTDEALLNEKADCEPTRSPKHGHRHGQGHGHGSTRKCGVKRVVKIVLLSIFVPIGVLALALGAWLLYVRLSYNPPPPTYSNMTEVLSLLANFSAPLEVSMNITRLPVSKANTTFNSSIPVQASGSGSAPVSGSLTSVLANMVTPPWSDCGSVLGKVEGFFIDECKPYMGEKRCSLPLEKDGNIRVIFRLNAGVTVTAPTFEACGKAIYTGTPCRNQPFSKPDPCVNSGLTCPLEGGQLYVYHNYGGVHQKDLPITLSFDTYADTYLRLRDPITKKLVFCVRMPSVIDVEPFD